MTKRWSVDQTIRAAEGLHPLAVQHRAALEPRLAPGFIDGLAADLASLRSLSAGAVAERSDRSSATISQNDAIKRGAALVSGLRRLLRSGARVDKALQKAFGVGVDVTPTVGAVSKALEMIINGATRHEAAARAAGVLPADITNARALLAAVGGADQAQEQKKLTAKQATAAAKVVHTRLADNLMHLDSVAQVALTPAQAGLFSALTPTTTKKKKTPAPA